MAKINDGTLKDWKDGDKVTADLYEADREILRAAINDTDSKTNANTTTASDHTKADYRPRIQCYRYGCTYDLQGIRYAKPNL
jgi:hypothetical protein